MRGEAGIGKTALLEYLLESASHMTVLRAVGVESEMELPYASLHQLCGAMLDRLGTLPAPQREALEVVFGLSAGPAPDRFLVGLGVLTLLSDAAEDRPLLCVVDDAQWLDHASAMTLAFVARRLLAEPVGIVFAVREQSEELRPLSEMEVRGLVNGDARALLGTVVQFMLDEQVRERIIAETHGNPLALLELPRGLTAGELAVGFGLVDPKALSGRIEENFIHRLEALPQDARRLMLLAAAEPVGDPVLLWRAAEQFGIEPGAADASDGTAQRMRPGTSLLCQRPGRAAHDRRKRAAPRVGDERGAAMRAQTGAVVGARAVRPLQGDRPRRRSRCWIGDDQRQGDQRHRDQRDPKREQQHTAVPHCRGHRDTVLPAHGTRPSWAKPPARCHRVRGRSGFREGLTLPHPRFSMQGRNSLG